MSLSFHWFLPTWRFSWIDRGRAQHTHGRHAPGDLRYLNQIAAAAGPMDSRQC